METKRGINQEREREREKKTASFSCFKFITNFKYDIDLCLFVCLKIY